MITKIYCGDIIPILEEKFPIDVHSIIGKFPCIPDKFIVFNKLKIDDNVTSFLYLKQFVK